MTLNWTQTGYKKISWQCYEYFCKEDSKESVLAEVPFILTSETFVYILVYLRADTKNENINAALHLQIICNHSQENDINISKINLLCIKK